MSITGLDPVVTTNSELFAQKTEVLGKDDFLKMLVVQLQNQDPLNPMEGTEFTAQLAQFSSLEQLNNVNENIEYLHLYQASLNNSQVVSFIGKTIKASGNSIDVTGGVSEGANFKLAGDASTVFVSIYGPAGNFVKTIEAGALAGGDHNTDWDGTDSAGNHVSDGIYTFEVVAVDVDGNTVGTTTFVTGEVSGVTFKDGTAYLLTGDRQIPVGSVIEVCETEI